MKKKQFMNLWTGILVLGALATPYYSALATNESSSIAAENPFDYKKNIPLTGEVSCRNAHNINTSIAVENGTGQVRAYKNAELVYTNDIYAFATESSCSGSYCGEGYYWGTVIVQDKYKYNTASPKNLLNLAKTYKEFTKDPRFVVNGETLVSIPEIYLGGSFDFSECNGSLAIVAE